MEPDELKKLRKQLGLTQSELAERLDMSLRGYQTIEAEGTNRGVYDLALRALGTEIAGEAFSEARHNSGVVIRAEARRAKIGSLKDGDVWVHQSRGGRLVGMIGGTEEERMLVIFGSSGTEYDDQGSGWLPAGGGDLSYEFAHALPNAAIELVRGPLGFPVPTDKPRNGCIVLDERGVGWLATRQPGKSHYFRLSDGKSGQPTGDFEYYRDWRVVWRPSGSDLVELFSTQEGPRPL